MKWFASCVLPVMCLLTSVSYAGTFVSHSSGAWDGGTAVWTVTNDADNIPDGNDTVTITSGTIITWGQSSIQRIMDLTVNVGGQLTGPNNSTYQLKIYGSYTNNGTETSRGIYSFQNTAGTGTLSGSGTFSQAAIWNILYDLTVSSSVTATKTDWTRIYYGADFTNEGNLTFRNLVRDYHAGTIFTNRGTLTIQDQNFMTGGAGGQFDASFAGNTVIINWKSGSHINIPTPSGAYHHLTISGIYTARTVGDLTINGDLTLQSGTTMNLNTQSHTLLGNFVSLGGTLQNGTMFTFDGTGAQTISAAGPLTFSFPCSITIGSSSTVSLNRNISVAGDITISGTLDVTSSNYNISLTGYWINTGTFVCHSGTVTLNGTAIQVLVGGTNQQFYNLTTNNSNGVIMASGSLSLINILLVNNGYFDLNGNSFTILSTASQTGRISALCSSCSIFGNITMQRYIAPGIADYRDLASPVASNATFSMWDNNLIISGPGFPDGCAYSSSGCFVSCKYYDEVSQTYADISAITDPIENLRGYEIYLASNTTNFGGATISVTGTVNGASDILKTTEPGWNLIGNPYCSDLDYDLVTKGSNVSDYFYIYDNTTGGFEYYDPGTGVSSGSINIFGIVTSSQGFWVETTAGDASSRSLLFPQSAKQSTNFQLVKADQQPTLSQAVKVKVSNLSNNASCASTLRFTEDATRTRDAKLDIPLFRGPKGPQPRMQPLIWFSDNDLRFHNIPFENKPTEKHPLTFETELSGQFRLSGEELDFNLYRNVLLYDKDLNTITNLNENDYVFSTVSGESTRFELILTDSEMSEVISSLNVSPNFNFTAYYSANQLQINLNGVSTNSNTNMEIYDVAGNIIHSDAFTGIQRSLNTESLANGIYIVRLTNGNRTASEKVVIHR